MSQLDGFSMAKSKMLDMKEEMGGVAIPVHGTRIYIS